MSQTLPSLMDESKVRDVSSMTPPASTCDMDMNVIRNRKIARIGSIVALSLSVTAAGEMLHSVVDQGPRSVYDPSGGRSLVSVTVSSGPRRICSFLVPLADRAKCARFPICYIPVMSFPCPISALLHSASSRH